ncbi:hypothetical protein Pla110_30840 [Polystyrenella longa]|uniref:AAA+ ATPase domain-containing protein n=1 Tax=Polystyrenella longa TaxID=2528007 RepID=A0A518CQ51_9PLAN|nr:AAA family ATPase [Polystyrenella longa]QDU81343.1 hypothetical protein Pla110_30840 [Polystyrenella longa]
MYEAFMGLSQRPFVASPDANMYARTEVHEKALRQLMFGMNANRGISLLTGAEGTGKSILARKLVNNLEESTIPIFFSNSHFATRRDFYQSILFELRQPYAGMGLQELRLQLTSVMRQMAPRHRPILMVIDEAHLLNDRILEEVRNCLNFVVEGDCVFRTLLVGHPELEERLAHPDMAAVNSRIGMHSMLNPLNRAQSVQYISQRLAIAHGKVENIFETEAVFAIAEAADGLPRAINQLCDHSLMLATARGIRPVDLNTVLDSLEELQTLPLHWRTPSAQHERNLEQTTSQVRSDQPAFEQFQGADSDNQSASIEVGSAWDEPSTSSTELMSVTETEEETFLDIDTTLSSVANVIETEIGYEDEFDANAEETLEIEEEEIDPELDARLFQLTDAETQQDVLAEVSLLNDVLNVQLKDDQEETSTERRIISSSSTQKNNLPSPTENAVNPSSEVVMDRYAFIDAGLVERVREWEVRVCETTVEHVTNPMSNEDIAAATKRAEEDVYSLLQEENAAQASISHSPKVPLGSISLEQPSSSSMELPTNALDKLKGSLPAGSTSFKFNRPSKSA